MSLPVAAKVNLVGPTPPAVIQPRAVPEPSASGRDHVRSAHARPTAGTFAIVPSFAMWISEQPDGWREVVLCAFQSRARQRFALADDESRPITTALMSMGGTF
jgi:hypothetical protein